MAAAASEDATPNPPPLQPEDDDETLKTHIQNWATNMLSKSFIYRELLSDVKIHAATKGTAKARLVLTDKHVNSRGGIHGSVSATIVDWAGGLAVATWDGREKTGVSVDLHVRYLASARVGDEVEIEATAEKVGGSLAFTRVVISKVVDGVVAGFVASGTHTKYVKV